MAAPLNILRQVFEARAITWEDRPDEDLDEDEREEMLIHQRVSRYRQSRNKEKVKRRKNQSIVRTIGSSLPLQNQRRRRSRRFKNRSIVRTIGSMLPLKPCKRAYFEMFIQSRKAFMDKAKTFVEDNVNTVRAHVPSLADIGLLWEDMDDNFIVNESNNQENSNELSGCGLDSISDNVNDNDFQSKDTENNGDQHKTSDKISALEDELAKLRAQIALIVTSQEQKPNTEIPAPPLCPPPPPPPPVLTSEAKAFLPRTPKKQLGSNNTPSAKSSAPSMSDVLKGLGSVKLRSSDIKRSPGGTPLKPRKSKQFSDSQDPADVIANALRKKFAKARRSIGSPVNDKENHLSPQKGFTPTPPSTPDSLENSDSVSPMKATKSASRRRSSILSGKTIILTPVQENVR